jgi:hypothetical protein
MWPTRTSSPRKLLQCAVFGLAIYLVSIVAANWLFSSTIVPHGTWYRLGLVVAAVGPGAFLWLRSRRFIVDGVSSLRWTEDELDWLRRQVERPAWSILSFALLAAMGVCLVFERHHPGFAFLLYLFLMPVQAITDLRGTLRRPVARAGLIVNWSSAKPLQSEHWGGAGNSHP